MSKKIIKNIFITLISVYVLLWLLSPILSSDYSVDELLTIIQATENSSDSEAIAANTKARWELTKRVFTEIRWLKFQEAIRAFYHIFDPGHYLLGKYVMGGGSESASSFSSEENISDIYTQKDVMNNKLDESTALLPDENEASVYEQTNNQPYSRTNRQFTNIVIIKTNVSDDIQSNLFHETDKEDAFLGRSRNHNTLQHILVSPSGLIDLNINERAVEEALTAIDNACSVKIGREVEK